MFLFTNVIQFGFFIFAMMLAATPIIGGLGFAFIDRYYDKRREMELIKQEAFVGSMLNHLTQKKEGEK